MTIQWYPGHMTKAKREIEERLKMVDMVIECRDSRIPLSSQNPLLVSLTLTKPRLIILTKKDKADKVQTEAWIKALSDENTKVMALDLFNDDVRNKVVEGCKLAMKPKFDKWLLKGIRPRKIRAMVLGIPNVGKSTLINQLGKKKVMVTADRPGITMALKWANVHPDLDLLDTPGVLWPRFDDRQVAMHLALTGAIKDDVLPLEEVAFEAFRFLNAFYKDRVEKRYAFPMGDEPVAFFTELADKRAYIKNGAADIPRAMSTLVREMRQDEFGPMTLERVP
jgi:ribosome biogenesis GTPase A